MNIDIASSLGLRPLDRLQIADRSELANFRRAGQPELSKAALPFWFFQRAMSGGLLEVATTSGYVTCVSPLDVCDIRRDSTPIIVKAMTRKTFLRRLSARCGQALTRPGPEDFADAYVLRVATDRWGRIDTCCVQFLDTQLNEAGRLFNAPLADGERERLQPLARSDRMPVSRASRRVAGFGGSSRGLRGENTKTECRVQAFFQAALQGDAAAVARLASADLGTVSEPKGTGNLGIRGTR